MQPLSDRTRAVAAIAGTAGFVGAWAVLGIVRGDGYSPISDPISRLAAVGAPTRVPMSMALVGYGLGVGLYSRTLRRAGLTVSARAAQVNALGSFAVAATPLDSVLGGAPHAIAAGTAYAALATMQVAALGDRAPVRRSITRATAAVTIGSLVLSVSGVPATGLWQRLGLGAGDVWIVLAAAGVAGGQAGSQLRTTRQQL